MKPVRYEPVAKGDVDYIQFGAVIDEVFERDVVEYSFKGRHGYATFAFGRIRWEIGSSVATTFDWDSRQKEIAIEFEPGKHSAWKRITDDDQKPEPEVIQWVNPVVTSDPETRFVTVVIGDRKLHLSPEAAASFASRLQYHAQRAKGM